ncbi:MAG TPA: non-homologous end-joining DNA ligase [Candidatus Polarisedimenticolaceae bacterium]|nr:non-homologous end-joining DNA ligase [Candidatus Polarisedimenticolaceae bacterium]
MLAVLAAEPFSDPDWVYERKLDGIRCLAVRHGDTTRLFSRNRIEQSARFPELVAALGRQPASRFVVDGEIVAFERGVTSFARLQQRGQREVRVYYYLFDLLQLADHDTTRLALLDRKALLRASLRFAGPLRYTPHRGEHGTRFLEQACRRGWEGLIAKRAGSTYVHRRSRDWLKLKCVHSQELVIGGYTDPRGQRLAFGALLVGYYAGGVLRYAGKVGTGFDEATLRRLGKRLAALEQRRSPFAEPVRERQTHWVRPRLVAQVAFSEWTRDGRLRHPRYLGLRDDKDAREVGRERAGRLG